MRRRIIAAVTSAALALAAAPWTAGAQSPTGQDLTPEGRGAYAAVAGANELYEIRSAEIALDRARRPQVREFAQTMLTEHRRATEHFEQVVRAAGLEDQLPPAMMPMHWDMLRQLEDASDSRFDRLYVNQQVEAHEIALELHRNFAERGNGPRLKAFAEATLPMVTRHLEQARQLDE